MRKLPSLQAVFLFAVAALIIVAVLNSPSMTGSAVLENAEVFPGKSSYEKGEMAHLFVVPASADYDLEVYGPDKKLYATSTDFPVEKAGNYTAYAVLRLKNITANVSTGFEVVENAKKGRGRGKRGKQSSDGALKPEQEEAQVAAKVNETIKDGENREVGRKIKDDESFETFFTSVEKRGNRFIVKFHHNSTTPQPVWVEKAPDYDLTSGMAGLNETVTLTIPLKKGRVPKFRLHVGPESDIFEFGIEVINLKSRPSVGGNWTVEFNTTGTANLTIRGIEGTEFSTDLEFLELRCGDNTLEPEYDGSRIFYHNYSCSSTGYETSKVITSGTHKLLFSFGSSSAIAENFASNYVCSGCTYKNLTDCLIAINNTDAGCFLNQSNTLYEMNSDYTFRMPLSQAAESVIRINATNITINCNDSTITGTETGYGASIDADNATLKNCIFRNFTFGLYINQSSYSDIVNNSFYDSGNYDITLSGSAIGTDLWLNDLYSRGINDSGSSNNYCTNGEGNFYAETINISFIGNGTGESKGYFGGDCGPPNITAPSSGDTVGTARLITSWTGQSSQKSITYYIYYSNDSASTWHSLGSTPGLTYNMSLLGMNESGNYRFRIVPSDGAYNGTNDNNSFTLEMNDWVCSNQTYCAYPNITHALDRANNTDSTLTLLDASRTYLLSGRGSYNISPPSGEPAIRINATNTTLNCDYGKIEGSGTGYGVLISGFDSDSVRKCYIYNYSQGILVNDTSSAFLKFNLIDYSQLSDLNITSTASNVNVSHNSFYSRGVNDSGSSSSFCVHDYLLGVPFRLRGNFYQQGISRDYIENTLHDCGLTNLTAPQAHTNHTGTIFINWTGQTKTRGNLNYSLRYSKDSGTSWHPITNTSNKNYSWNVSGMADMTGYMISVRPFDSLHYGTNDNSSVFGIDNSEPDISILNETDGNGISVTFPLRLGSGEQLIINAEINDTFGVDKAWIDFWSEGNGSSVVWSQDLSLASGTIYDGVWRINITLNESFPEFGHANYTVYSNDSTTNLASLNDNFTIVDNEMICANTSSCEYSNITQALIEENLTSNTITFMDSGANYTISSQGIYNISPSPGRGALEFNASDVTLDCRGSVIEGMKQGYGAFSEGFNNLTLINCTFREYLTGVYIKDSQDANLSWASSSGNSYYGIMLESVNSSLVEHSSAESNARENILLVSSHHNLITYSNTTESSGSGMNLSQSSYNTLNELELDNNAYEAVSIGSGSNNTLIANSTLSNSTLESLITVKGHHNNITANTFRDAADSYYGIHILYSMVSNNIWLNNFYSGGVMDNGTSTSLCVNVISHLEGGVYSAKKLTQSKGNYYNSSINSSFAPVGSCGNLTEPFDDSDNDGYYSILHDCLDSNKYTYPGATEYCDDIDNDCDGSVDDGACSRESFPSAGSGSSGGSAIGGLSIEGKEKKQNIDENPVFVLYRGEAASFEMKGKKQVLRLNKVYFDKINLSIESLGRSMTLEINQSQSFDIDDDTLNDFEVSLSSIKGSAAVLEVSSVTRETRPEQELEPEEKDKETEKKQKEDEEGKESSEEKPSRISEAGKKALSTGRKMLKYGLPAVAALAVVFLLGAGAVSYSRFIGNVKRAEDYVENAFEKGVSKTKVRRKLIDAGWEPQVVDSILKMESRAMMKRELEKKINEALEEGVSREDIKKSLIERGWKESDIDGVMK